MLSTCNPGNSETPLICSWQKVPSPPGRKLIFWRTNFLSKPCLQDEDFLKEDSDIYNLYLISSVPSFCVI